MAETLVTAREVTKVYHADGQETPALRGVNLEVWQGDFLALVGPSGSGKTTLLNLIGALDTPTGGTLTVLGKDLAALNRRQRADLRLHGLGFVFQAYNLVPVLTAQENVEFVLELQGAGRERAAQAKEVLKEMGMADFLDRRAARLSGGQQQRVAVARALATHPQLVLADEPTANLDSTNAEALMDIMRGLRDRYGMTFIFSTHDSRVVAHASRVVQLQDGVVVSDVGEGNVPFHPDEKGNSTDV